jgi:hypothetical protein
MLNANNPHREVAAHPARMNVEKLMSHIIQVVTATTTRQMARAAFGVRHSMLWCKPDMQEKLVTKTNVPTAHNAELPIAKSSPLLSPLSYTYIAPQAATKPVNKLRMIAEIAANITAIGIGRRRNDFIVLTCAIPSMR